MPINEKARLEALRALKILDTPPEERFDRITRLAQRTFGMPIAAFCLVDEKRLWLKSVRGLDLTELPRSAAFTSEAILGRELLLVPDALKDARFEASPFVTGEPRVRFYAGQPVAGPDGSVVGALVLIDRAPRELDLEQRRALRDLAGMIEEQLAAPGAGVADDAGEHAKLLESLREAPERRVTRRRAQAGFAAAALAVLAVTAVSMRISGRLAGEADRVEASWTQGPPASAAAGLARIRATGRFLRRAAGARALGAWVLLAAAWVIYARDAETRLSEHADVQLARSRLERLIAGSARAERHAAVRDAVERAFAEAGGGDPIPAVLESLGAGLERVYVELWIVDKSWSRLRQEASWRDDSLPAVDFARLSFDATFKRGVGLAGRVWESRASLWVPDLAKDANFPRAAAAAEASIRSAFAVPALAQGEVLGVLSLFGAGLEEPDAEVLALAEAVGARLGLFLERKKA